MNVNINSLTSNHTEGLYSLLYTASKLDANKFSLQHNLTYQGRDVSSIDRLKHITLIVDEQAIVLDKGTIYTGIATWNENADDNKGEWDSVTENWTTVDSNGQIWKTFINGDIVNFASDKSQTIQLKETIEAADIFVSGRANYTFRGEGITIKKIATTFDPTSTSQGKLILGQIMNDDFTIGGQSDKITYNGRVDLTNTVKNTFEGGIDLYGGTVRVSTKEQLGTTLDQVNFLSESNSGVATLAVKSDSQMTFMDEVLTVANGKTGRLQLERNAKVTFGSDPNSAAPEVSGIVVNDGILTLNTATGSILEMQNQLTGSGDVTLNKIGSGTLSLAKDTTFTGSTRVNVQEGMIDLGKDANFTLSGQGSSFTLGSTGRHTQPHLSGNNTLDVDGDIILNTGGKNGSTMLSFDVTGDNRFDLAKGETATSDNAVLSLKATGDLKTSSDGAITIDVASLTPNKDGLYTLLYTDHQLDVGKFNATLSYKGRSTANIDRLNPLSVEFNEHSIVLNQGVIFSGDATWTGLVAEKNGTLIWDVEKKNWDVTDAAGKKWETFFDGDKVTFGDNPGKDQAIKVSANGTKHLVDTMTVNSQYDYRFEGDQIEIENGLTKEGSGSLIFNNSVLGNMLLNNGSLVLGGSKTVIDVTGDITANKGTLSGNAKIKGDVMLGDGAILSPGNGAQPNSNAFGTLTANSFNFKSGSTYQVDADEKGNSDKIVATSTQGGSGMVSIDKDVNMSVRAGAGLWHDGQSVVVIEADKGVEGSFDKLTTNLDFLNASLDYSEKDKVTLNLERNDTRFDSVGLTYNTRSVAGALDGLGNDHAVVRAFQGMSFAEAARSFDNISGEIYASTQKALFQSSRFIGQKMKGRLTLREGEAFRGTPERTAQDAFWMQALGYDGTIKGDGNAAKMERKGSGLLIGYDKVISTDHNFTLGFAGGYEDMKLKVKDTRSSESKVKAMHFMIYAGTQLGDSGFDLKGGFNYSYLRFNANRSVNINSIAGRLKSKYRGHQYQAFVEVSRLFTFSEFDNMEMMPYIGMSHTEVKSNGFRESGGLATLEAKAQSNSQSNAVLGVRNNWFFGEDNAYSISTDLGWQYDFGHKFQDYDLSFVDTGRAFNVRSTTSSRSSALVGIGFTGQKDNLEFNVGYQGQFGSKLQEHSINANLIWKLKGKEREKIDTGLEVDPLGF